MSEQDQVIPESNVDSHHQTIMQGGKIEEFADALGRFCRAEGWKKLKDENGEPFRSLRHYVEAKPPFGAGYSGKSGMAKIEAYLSLNPRVKDYFQHCHANCLSDMAQEQGITPAAVSKKEWDDVKGARLAKVIETNPEEAYEEKAAAYVENKERVKPAPRPVSEYAPIRMSYRPTHTYQFAQKLKESVSEVELSLLVDALKSSDLDELVEFEKYYNSAFSALKRAKTDSGWGNGAVRAPEEYCEREPSIKLSKWLAEDDENGASQLSLNDELGKIVIVKMSKAGNVKDLVFD